MKFFNDFAETRKTRNTLPHWQQEGATYFVTWRLADSIPQELLDKLRLERAGWIVKNPEPWDDAQEKEFHMLFSGEADRRMDEGRGSCVLRETDNAEILCRCLLKFDGERYLIHSYVVMPNHAHILFSLAEGQTLEDVVGAWKRYSAIGINRRMGRDGTLWQRDYFDRLIRNWQHMIRVARYIRRNPGKGNVPDGQYTLHESDWVRRMLA